MKLHPEILEENQRELFDKIKTSSLIDDFYLAGGTALALQIGHRLSEDFDFFTNRDFNVNDLSFQLAENLNFKKVSEDINTLIGVIDNIRVSFIGFKYKTIGEFLLNDNLRIASVQDIACMKLSAITQRSTKKDFVDIYYLLHTYSLKKLFEYYNNKFDLSEYESVLKKSLVYFRDAEDDPMPKMIKDISWTEVKRYIEEKVFGS
ncbi:MAG: nucleotidyl transferase AbiEii/AbiGii toxin family protein [Ignavibacteria bacterium]|nr:nucleotidyl transferase AbiEii/AbiGii toxin family protein [Ignavibacteria bacterium]